MRTENLQNPCCPRCAKTLRLNGRTLKGKTRFRCSRCGYTETENSTAHNRNTRTWFGHSKPPSLEAQYKQRTRVYSLRHTNKALKCDICDSTEKLENHHFDYDRPLDVTKLCKNCHVLTERILRKLEQNPYDPELIYLLFGISDSPLQSVNQGQKNGSNLCYPLALRQGVSYPVLVTKA